MTQSNNCSNVIKKCIELFDLLPTTPTYKWLRVIDWMQKEKISDITVNAIRECIWTLEIIDSETGRGYRCGDGNMSYSGEGETIHGRSYGIGDGQGNGRGSGYGNGDGFDSGNGDGDGVGDGCGCSDGAGDGVK